MESSTLLYAVWVTSTGLALAGAWAAYSHLKRRDRYIDSLLNILGAVPEYETFEQQAENLCRICNRQAGASGTTLYLQPGEEESGFRRAALAGEAAETTGPGVVRDLLTQAWKSGKPAEASHAGRYIMAAPVWPGHRGGGALLMFWEQTRKPGAAQRSLVDVIASVAALLAPRFEEEGALARARHQIETLQAKAEQEIQTLQAEVAEESHLASVGRLAAGVAHELNTPLGAVLAMVTSLLRKEDNPDKVKRMTIVKEAVDKCKNIIQKLLVYSRAPVETEEGLTFSRFVRADTDLNKVIANTVELLRESFAPDGVTIKTDLNELPAFRANSTQWSHVFNNLLTNSRDAMKKEGVTDPTIWIRTGHDKDRITIEVYDNGPGIPDDIRPKIFQPFFTTKDVGHGTGLGLAICKEVVHKHQGTIEVGKSEQGGAMFRIRIEPQRAENAAAAGAPVART